MKGLESRVSGTNSEVVVLWGQKFIIRVTNAGQTDRQHDPNTADRQHV